jgi:hypothetical protein
VGETIARAANTAVVVAAVAVPLVAAVAAVVAVVAVVVVVLAVVAVVVVLVVVVVRPSLGRALERCAARLEAGLVLHRRLPQTTTAVLTVTAGLTATLTVAGVRLAMPPAVVVV